MLFFSSFSLFFRVVDSLKENQTCLYCMRRKKKKEERETTEKKTRLCRYLLHFCFSIVKNNMTCVPLINRICIVSLSKHDTDELLYLHIRISWISVFFLLFFSHPISCQTSIHWFIFLKIYVKQICQQQWSIFLIFSFLLINCRHIFYYYQKYSVFVLWFLITYMSIYDFNKTNERERKKCVDFHY